MRNVTTNLITEEKTNEACTQKTWLKTDFDMVRKFTCYCNLCEHESSACPQSKEAHMEKIILKFANKFLM